MSTKITPSTSHKVIGSGGNPTVEADVHPPSGPVSLQERPIRPTTS
jgi:hypothetical protein